MRSTVGQNDWRVQPDNTIQVVNPKAPQRKGVVAGAPEPQKNYRGLIIAWLIIFVVLLAVVISVVIIGVRDPRHVLIGRRLTVQDVLQNSFRSPEFFAAWRGDKLLYKDSVGDLREYNVVENRSNVIFHLPAKEEITSLEALISSDGRYVLDRRKVRYGLRGAVEAQFTVQDVNNGNQFPVHLSRDSLEDPYLQVALFAPSRRPRRTAGDRSDTYSLAVVYSGDIYFLPSPTENVEAVRLTTTAADGQRVLNGVTNWWYRETLLASPQAMWFSPSGDHVAFVSFNDSALHTVDTLSYRGRGDALLRQMPYPKRNGALTQFTISICNLKTTATTKSPDITEIDNSYLASSGYLTSVQWAGDATVAVTTMSRDLTSGQVILCTAPAWRCTEVYAAANWRWVSKLQPVFAEGGTDFILRAGDAGDHDTELVEVRGQGGGKIRHKTQGHRIQDILYWDQLGHWIYYTAVTESRPSETHLFRRPDSATRRRSPADCLTCDVHLLLGRRCDAVRPLLRPAHDVTGHSGDVTALECTQGAVRSLHVVDLGAKRHLAVLDTSEDLRKRMRQLAVPQVFTEMMALDGEMVQMEVMLPKLWDEKKGGSYMFPMVLDIEDDVLELDWSKDFAVYMVSKWDLVFIRVKVSSRLNNRSFFGNQKRTSTILSHLIEQYPYLDPTQTAVLGTAFGGHSALVALADSPLVNCGAVMWPIVELDMYDAYHSERYKDSTNILDSIERISDHSLYLMYGTGDPLFVHGDLLSKRLVEAGVLFYQQVYSDEDVYFRSVRSHVIKSLEDFLIPNCFPQLISMEADEE